MKRLKYQVMGRTMIFDPTTEQETMHEAPATIETAWSEEAEAHARQVALGEVKIYDDGEGTDAPTIEKRVAALEDSSAEMTQALDMILSGVTE